LWTGRRKGVSCQAGESRSRKGDVGKPIGGISKGIPSISRNEGQRGREPGEPGWLLAEFKV
jgi:hypothetical protein